MRFFTMSAQQQFIEADCSINSDDITITLAPLATCRNHPKYIYRSALDTSGKTVTVAAAGTDSFPGGPVTLAPGQSVILSPSVVKWRLLSDASGATSAFPFKIIQESAPVLPLGQFGATSQDVFSLIYPQPLAASGTSSFILLAVSAVNPWVTPTGWTIVLDTGTGTDYPRIVLLKRTGTAGQILASTLGSSIGTGYAPGDVSQLPGAIPQLLTVGTVDGSGGVLTYTLTDYPSSQPGQGYTVASNVATTVNTGGGDGTLTINITSVGDRSADFVSAVGMTRPATAYFFEIQGTHALDQSATGGVNIPTLSAFPYSAYNQLVNFPSITPTSGAWVFGVASITADFLVSQNPCLNPNWRMLTNPGIFAGGFVGSMAGFASNYGASGVSEAPPQASLSAELLTGTLTWVTFSIV